jgi:hypothetical protein
MAKDLMRMARVDKRTHHLQTGHIQRSVSLNYGAKALKVDESTFSQRWCRKGSI